MATLLQLHALSVGSPVLETRFRAARLVAAWDILSEATGTTNHAARLAWAHKVIDLYDADSAKEFRRFLSNTTIQTVGEAATDSDVQFVVNSFVDTYATG